MNALRTLALSLVLVSTATFAGERQALETYLSPAPSLMPILVKQAGDLGLSAEQQAKLADWRAYEDAGDKHLASRIPYFMTT